ncbi:DUF1684 domain-containing protein [Flavobacteriaceae bacterium S0825]|uniref:DUF1684 domain-containing protein n=1 Tax=Gaetbulibacter sp. S0825 TaxID=2720084 RepID=UPI00143132CC|nr:DUF1684 domain-containing protein [Gaetbulibacter sp. S0825]MCK0109250.1 DUF1684 domain-containing protein [Flavobacteriaceae bacterium S0825]NIX64885.1 DUF1684 domain-containing protein [Gaetbulibacter sp. S0825]
MRILQILIIAIVFTSCKNNDNRFVIDDNYRSEIKTFFNAKMAERKGDYLQLIALHKLDTVNTFGSDSINDIKINSIDFPSTIGTIFTHPASIFATHNEIPVKNENDSIITNFTLSFNKYGSSEKLHYNQVSWQIITRSNQRYLRVWDSKNPAIESFKGFEKFDLNNNFILEGEFNYYDKEKSEVVKAKVDGKRSINFIGKVSFDYQNKTYTLDVGTDGFTMVGDITNGDTTYGGGRYFYLDLPKQNGLVKIDFNKLYNPPCAFSEYTTCLYPPRQNQLPFKVLAGETITLLNQPIQN